MLLDKMGSKSKQNRKTNKKKAVSSVHPYVEAVQSKLSLTQEDYNKLEEYENKRELTTEELTQKQKLKTTIEAYEDLLLDYNTSSSTKAKLRSYQDREAHEARQRNEAQILELLNLFYLVRVGSLGTFDPIDFPNKESLLRAAMDACDQMVGASIYCKVYHSSQVRLRKKEHIIATLKKLETGSNELIMEGISFKQIKEFMQHIWDYATCVQEEENEKDDVDDNKHEEDVLEQPKEDEEEGEEERKTKNNKEDTVVERQQKDEHQEGENTSSTNGKEETILEESTEEGKDHQTEEKEEEGWGEPPAAQKDTWTQQEQEDDKPSSSWDQVDTVVTQDAQQDWNPPTQDYADANDNWRRRDSTDNYNKRGRGNSNGRSRGTRARGRGRGSSRGHGSTLSRGSSRGRGRGRGGRDEMMTDTI
ncbi:hypothetical protein EDC96DRAFT_567991 [Choanephora cucurbitarum]|nr:hypothetical protein EDC96DRAFT_567991 [Choanephora cucurbitarum]